MKENENRCVMCGEIIPEGIQVCINCIKEIERKNKNGFKRIRKS